MAAGATLSAVTARLNGARLTSIGIASAVGSLSGAAGGLIGNSDRGMGGAHAAGVAIGTVNIIGGKGTSLAMEVSAATFGAASGFITGVKHSARVGQYAAYGSYTGGIIGRHADNIAHMHLIMLAERLSDTDQKHYLLLMLVIIPLVDSLAAV